MDLFNIRRDYGLASLEETQLPENPIELFKMWLNKATELEILDSTAMVLSTSTKSGRPSSRVVLLKKLDEMGFYFFTNYNSRKGHLLNLNPYVAITFYWAQLERQVRIEGRVSKTESILSDEYFMERSFESRISSVISPQSKVIPDRIFLQNSFDEYKHKYNEESLKRPEYWGGYLVKPTLVEFWQGRSNRLHDRIQYRFKRKKWMWERLAP